MHTRPLRWATCGALCQGQTGRGLPSVSSGGGAMKVVQWRESSGVFSQAGSPGRFHRLEFPRWCPLAGVVSPGAPWRSFVGCLGVPCRMSSGVRPLAELPWQCPMAEAPWQAPSGLLAGVTFRVSPGKSTWRGPCRTFACWWSQARVPWRGSSGEGPMAMVRSQWSLGGVSPGQSYGEELLTGDIGTGHLLGFPWLETAGVPLAVSLGGFKC